MWTDKYVEGKDEVAIFIKGASDFLAKVDFLLQYGVWRLDFGMYCWRNVDKKPSFDPTTRPPPYPYGEKNLYINASNNLWQAAMWRSYSSISEIYYSTLLEKIKEFKKKNDGFDFNKGIVYANLGVAQSAQMKLDEGYANILKALMDDYPYSDTYPESSVWKSPLFVQFEKHYVTIPLQAIISQLGMPQIHSADSFIEGFFNSLSNDQRTFFEYTFARIKQNKDIWNERENSLTANRLLAYTQDLCLFNEDFLKSKFTDPEPRWLLDDLIKEAGFKVNLKCCGATKMTDLDTKLSNLARSNQPRKCLRTLMTIRNYSSHNVGGGTSRNYFYAHYEDILRELIRAMCEIALLPKPIPRSTTK
jgi:hypothetical protein